MSIWVILIEIAVFSAIFTAIVFFAASGDRKHSPAAIHNYPPDRTDPCRSGGVACDHDPIRQYQRNEYAGNQTDFGRPRTGLSAVSDLCDRHPKRRDRYGPSV